MAFDQWGHPCDDRRREGDVVVTVPNIINDGPGGKGSCGGGEKGIPLSKFADYLIARMQYGSKFGQFNPSDGGDWPGDECSGWPGGKGGFGPGSGFNPFPQDDIRLSIIGAKADTPMQIIGIVPVDGMYEINAAIVCKTADAGATTMTLTITYMDVIAGLSTIVLTLPLTAAAVIIEAPATKILLGSSGVTASAVLTGAYGAASYDAFVSFKKVA